MGRALGFVASALLVLGTGVSLAFAESPELGDLSWMAGHWEARTERAHQEEIWMEPSGGVMPGLHRDVFGPSRSFFEFLRIERAEGGIVYFASPAGRPATPFPLVELEGQRAVFENPGHDFPQRIIYTRDGDRLCAAIEGEQGGEKKGSRWCWNLVR